MIQFQVILICQNVILTTFGMFVCGTTNKLILVLHSQHRNTEVKISSPPYCAWPLQVGQDSFKAITISIVSVCHWRACHVVCTAWALSLMQKTSYDFLDVGSCTYLYFYHFWFVLSLSHCCHFAFEKDPTIIRSKCQATNFFCMRTTVPPVLLVASSLQQLLY